MANPYFNRLSGDDETGRFRASESTAGPWSPQLQHGGPPNALAVTLAERVLRTQTGRDDMVALRLASDFVGPVPVGDIDTRVTVVRAARSAALVDVVIGADGRDCLRVRVWFVRRSDTADIAAPAGAPPPPLPDRTTVARTWDFGYGVSIDWRYVQGDPDGPGPAAAWARGTVPLLDDDAGLPGLARVVLVADSASGISRELDWAKWSFVNVDLDVHLARPLVGDWVLLDASTTLGPAGSALARSTVSDPTGVIGTGLQTLVVAPVR